MGKKTVKAAAAIALFGTVLQFGGCIGALWKNFASNAVSYAVTEFVLDNDAVFDLFAD